MRQRRHFRLSSLLVYFPRSPKLSNSLTLLLICLTICLGYFGLRCFLNYMYLNMLQESTMIRPVFLAFPVSTHAPRLPTARPTKVVLEAKKGDTFLSLTNRFGLDSSTTEGIRAALSGQVGLKDKKIQVWVGQRYEFNLTPQRVLSSLVFQTKDDTKLRVQRDANGRFSTKLTEVVKVERERIAVGLITTSFADAAAKSGVSYDTIDDMVDLFSSRVEFNKDLQLNDRFTLILSGKEAEDDSKLQDSVILAAALSVNGKQMMAVRYVGSDGKSRYFDESGQLIGDAFLRYPLKFSHISSAFSYARFHPILRKYRPHNGVDFAAPIGTPVRSVANGVIKYAGHRGASGLMIEIQHGKRYITNYLHLSKINSEARPGAKILRGQIIGAVGNTGRSTGPHLHYGFYDNGKYVDPLKIKLPMMEDLTKGTRIDSAYLKRVMFTLANYQSMKSPKPDWYNIR